MKTLSLLGLAASVLTMSMTVSAQTQTPARAVPTLKAGDVAPPFSLAGSDGKTHRLSDYKGRAVVLAWFPRAFSGG